jgi:phage shock protein PspC (stress-responsive transcriptional regulator)
MDSTANISKRLYKSRNNRIIDGICGGVAEYFEVDPTIVRILWTLITLLGGTGFILYIVAMVIMPVNPEHLTNPQPINVVKSRSDRRSYWGIVLILAGVFVLVDRLGWFTDLNWWSFSRSFVFPVSLIGLGLLFIYVHTRKSQTSSASGSQEGMPEGSTTFSTTTTQAKELRRSLTDKKVCGVCGGIAKYFEIDSTLVRIIYVVFVFASAGWAIPLYIILCLLMPMERLGAPFV